MGLVAVVAFGAGVVATFGGLVALMRSTFGKALASNTERWSASKIRRLQAENEALRVELKRAGLEASGLLTPEPESKILHFKVTGPREWQ